MKEVHQELGGEELELQTGFHIGDQTQDVEQQFRVANDVILGQFAQAEISQKDEGASSKNLVVLEQGDELCEGRYEVLTHNYSSVAVLVERQWVQEANDGCQTWIGRGEIDVVFPH